MTKEVTSTEFMAMGKDPTIQMYSASPKKTGGYSVQYGLKTPSEPSVVLCAKPELPTPPARPQSVPEPSVAMVKCFDCGNLYPATEQQCWICSRMIEIQRLARINRRDYAIKKSMERTENANTTQSA